MEIERRERDPDTGEIAPSEASLIGAGFGDVFGKIVAKLTGKTAKKLATKAAEKLVEKGAEKVGEKTGQLVGEKIYDKFSTKPSAASEAPRGAPEGRRALCASNRRSSPRNKRKRNWEDACGEAAPFGRCFIPSRSEATQKQISKNK